jgi:hypothetical protein
MLIKTVKIQGLRVLQNIERSLQPDAGLNDGDAVRPWDAVCVRGVNGAGKTTLLSAIAELWQWFRRCSIARAWRPPATELLAGADLVAIELVELPGPRPTMWLAWGKIKCLRELKGQVGSTLPIDLPPGNPVWDAALLEWWDEQQTRAESGLPVTVPNVVYIEAENKWVSPVKGDELVAPRKGPPWAAVARYLPESRGPSSLEGLLGTLKLINTPAFEELQRHITTLFPGLSLVGFSEGRRPLFKMVATEELLTTDRLSAGQRSSLINFVMVFRWMSSGAIVLLDEPELHQHISLMRGSVATLEYLTRGREGQLIVASHAPDVWEHFWARKAFIDLLGAGE